MSATSWLGRVAASLLVVAATGCATVGNAPGGTTPAAASAPSPADPWENWNRKVYAFNEGLDNAIVKPVATTYRDVVPSFIRTGISNVLGNIRDVWSTANHLLQGKVLSGVDMGLRVFTNTVVGLGGLFDPATSIGLERRSEDFGQTLGRWGLGNGPYVVLPLLGPSTLRDTAGLLVDRQVSPASLPPTTNGALAVTAVEVLSLRTELLPTTAMLDQIALDKYSFVRDAYLQRRRDALYDGAPPMEDEFADETAKEPGAKSAVKAAPAAAPAAAAPAAAKASAPAAAASSATPTPLPTR
jgi:phospholipid-binding lipoprotein MlaA